MIKRYHSVRVAFLCITTLFIHVCPEDFVPPDDGCVLNFTSYPYQPTGECIGDQMKVNFWDTVPSTLCCRNALNVFSQALALHTHNRRDDNIFIEQNEWNNCGSPFQWQNSVTVQSCGFDDFYQGSSVCSSIPLSTIKQGEAYESALHLCSQLNSSFDFCLNCSEAILMARDAQFELLQTKKADDTEKAICGVAVVVAVAAELSNSSIDNYYSCLSALDDLEPGYIKLKKSVVKAVFAISIAIIAVMMVLLLIKYVTKKNVKSKKNPKPLQYKETWSGLYRFSRAEIENAINFGTERKSLGRGSAGQVYKGVLPSGQVVAIKHIFKSNTSDSFTREVEGLSRIRHPNLVCLFGCCIEGGEQYLVYEYCPSGNLAQHLLRKDSVLTWERRVKILRDCALALRYLHHYIDGCIVHRDIKLTNILLTEDLDPKLSDFGLAKMLGMEESKVFTDVRGTIGYMDPEYMSNAKLTCASDIYSFGIVALQLLSGQKVIELDLDARDQLTRKARDVTMGKRPPTDLEDPRLKGNVNMVDFEAILQVAVLCVAKSSKGRPPIDVVFEEMEKAWKNTVAEMKALKQVSASATPLSRSLDVIPV